MFTSIRSRVLAFVLTTIMVVCVVFSYLLYDIQKTEYLEGVDKRLLTGAHMAKALVGDDFHDKIDDENSVSKEDYLKIVDAYNKICLKTGFQYLWSNLVIDKDTFVFTTGTSTSKNVDNGDHALFFDVHSDPRSNDLVLKSGKATYSSFHNEWGGGRMLLIPHFDNRGRQYVFGASISTKVLTKRLRATAMNSALVFVVMAFVGTFISIIIANAITGPIRKLNFLAQGIAVGDYEQRVGNISTVDELATLAENVNIMSEAISSRSEALIDARDQLENRVTERTQELTQEIQERKKAEANIMAARKQAETANRAKSELLANMSHELRTPLNAIIGFSETIQAEIHGELSNDKYREYIGDINASGVHLLELINDILDVSAIEAGKLELHESKIQIPHIVESCIRLISPRVKYASINLSCSVPGELPELWVDERRVKQVLLNVLSNAVKFTPEGGDIHLTVETIPSGLTMSVQDTGIGMDKKGIAAALEKFGQVNSKLSRTVEGTGLGLPLSVALMELHDGKLKIDSTPGKGTHVILEFPTERLKN